MTKTLSLEQERSQDGSRIRRSGLFWLSLFLGLLALVFAGLWYRATVRHDQVLGKLHQYGMYYSPAKKDIYYYATNAEILSIEERLDAQSFDILGRLLEAAHQVSQEEVAQLVQGIRQAKQAYLIDLETYVEELAVSDRWTSDNRQLAMERVADEHILMEQELNQLVAYYDQPAPVQFTEAKEEEIQTLIYNLIVADSLIFDYPEIGEESA